MILIRGDIARVHLAGQTRPLRGYRGLIHKQSVPGTFPGRASEETSPHEPARAAM